MKVPICPFGPFYRERRELHKISLWKLCLATGCHLRNVQRIEAGQNEPSVELAIRMVAAIKEDVGEFFLNLAGEQNIQIFAEPLCFAQNLEEMHCCEKKAGLFGLMLRQARQAAGISQRALSESAGYNLRNLSNLENCRQNPGVMKALALVCATGCNPKHFFQQLAKLYQKWDAMNGEYVQASSESKSRCAVSFFSEQDKL